MAQLPNGTLVGGIGVDTNDIIGAGGWITRLDAADDGTMVCGSDATGPRIRKPGAKRWHRLYKPDVNGPLHDTSLLGHQTWDVAVCATNSDVVYWVTSGRLCKTTNGGQSFTVTSLTSIPGAEPNEKTRETGKPLAVDPVNPNVVLVGTPESGVKISSDGGASFTTISGLPNTTYVWDVGMVNYSGAGGIAVGDTLVGQTSGATVKVAEILQEVIDEVNGSSVTFTGVQYTGTFVTDENMRVSGVTKGKMGTLNGNPTIFLRAGARYLIAFDRHSAVVGGKTQGIYVFVTTLGGSGLWHSTNGGTTWSNISGGPSTCGHMRVSPHDGYVHLAGWSLSIGRLGLYHRWDGSSWLNPPNFYAKSIAVSPHNAGHIYVAGDGGGLNVSIDNGANWSNWAGPLRKAIDIPWHEWCNEAYMSNGDIIFAGDQNRLWCGEGIGAWYLDNPPTSIAYGSAVTWFEASVGIENMVNTHMQVAPDGKLLYACHDRRGFVIPRDEVGKRYPAVHALGPGAAIAHGGNMDYAPEDLNRLVLPVALSAGAVSSDGGASWQSIPGDIRAFSGRGGGGNIAVLSYNVWIQRETQHGTLQWTKDGGVTWTKFTPGGSDTPYYVSHQDYWANHRPLIKDKYVPNQAFVQFTGGEQGDANDLMYRGIWRINYNPTTETMTMTRVKGPSNPWIASYGQDYWHVEFAQLGVDDWLWCGGDNCIGLWRSTDGMATWSQMSGTDDVHGSEVRGFSEVYGVAVGAGRNPGEQTIFACGFRVEPADNNPANFNSFGFWLSEDTGATWKRITKLLDGSPNPASCVAADPEVYGLFYAGPASEGIYRIRYQDKRTWG